MIKKVKYRDIDFEKYTHCLKNSVQQNWYAQKEILDQLSGSWEILVKDDYNAVMPVHLTRKFGLRFVHMPLFCQQLGVFSECDDDELNEKFLRFLHKNFRVYLYCFNDNNFFKSNLDRKKNYVIPVSDYSFLRNKTYFKGRKSTVKSAQKLVYRESGLGDHEKIFIKNHFKGLPKESDFKLFQDYLEFLMKNNSLKICCAYKEETLTNVAVLVLEDHQISLLALINSEKYRTENGASFLIDKILEHYIHEKSLNFMGSNLRGIELFFKSFGGNLQNYAVVENRFLKIFA